MNTENIVITRAPVMDATRMPEYIQESLYSLCGDADAVEYMERVWFVTQIWDDLADGDSPTVEEVNESHFAMSVEIPQNGFYRRNMHLLTPAFTRVILDWHVANEMEEARQGEDMNRAYVLRASLWGFFHYVIYLCKGPEATGQIGRAVWGLYAETLDGFRREKNDA